MHPRGRINDCLARLELDLLFAEWSLQRQFASIVARRVAQKYGHGKIGSNLIGPFSHHCRVNVRAVFHPVLVTVEKWEQDPLGKREGLKRLAAAQSRQDNLVDVGQLWTQALYLQVILDFARRTTSRELAVNKLAAGKPGHDLAQLILLENLDDLEVHPPQLPLGALLGPTQTQRPKSSQTKSDGC